MYELYKIYNKDVVVYIGITRTSKGTEKRFKEHIKAATYDEDNSLLHKKMKQFGVSNFHVERIMTDIPDDKAGYLEQEYIKLFNTFYKDGIGYNMTRGGHGCTGYVFTEEDKAKMSAKSKEFWKSYKGTEKYCRQIAAASERLRGVPKTLEHRKNLSLSRKGKFCKQDNPFYGKHHSEETRRMLSLKHGLPVCMIDMTSNELIETFSSAKDAADYLLCHNLTRNKYANSRILEICHGKGKTAYGFIWKFSESVTTNSEMK